MSTPGTAGGPLRIALVNDHEIVVRGLERMLDEFTHLRVVELAAGAPVDTPVDVALYDTFSVPQVDASDVDEVVANPHVGSVAVFSWNMHTDLVEQALRKGVRGYLSKSLRAPALVDAIERVARGEEVVAPEHEVGPRGVSAEIIGGDWPGRAHGLSARQAEVVTLITQGFSNQEIADRTHLTMNTVKTYIRMAYRHMGVSSRTQAVLWGIEHEMTLDSTRVRRS